MSDPVLIAEELRELITPGELDLELAWWGTAKRPAGDAVALVPTVTRQVSRRDMESLPRLKIVANVGVGYDNIDVGAAQERGLIVTNTPDVLTEATADLTMGLVIACARRFREGLEMITTGTWTGWHPAQLLGLELSGSTLGIVGPGRIGTAVARRARAFGMNVLYHSRSRHPDLEAELGATHLPLQELLEGSEVVSLHTPLTGETRDLIGPAELRRMRRGSILINTARGEVLDEGAALEALDEGHLDALGLDVFRGEPRVDPRLAAHPRVFALPHLGSATGRTRRAMAQLALDNVREVLKGRDPLTPIAR